jgi:hypothetical protein
MTPVELDAQLTSSFGIYKSGKKKAYVILVKGKRVILSSGKHTWSTLGHAKSALTNHLFYCYRGLQHGDTKNWVDTFVQFVPLTEYEISMEKLQSK